MGLQEDSAAWRAAQALADQARLALIESVKSAAAGGLSEYAIAKEVAVTRVTVRAWLGKGRT